MIIEDVRNNHIKEVIRRIQDSEGYTIPIELSDLLIKELKLATFIRAANVEVILDMAGTENLLIEVFTDLDEFNKYSREVSNPIVWEFAKCYEYLDRNLYGVLINPGSDNYFVPFEMIIIVLEQYPTFTGFFEKKSVFEIDEINEIRNVSNDSLNKLLDKKADFEDLCEALAESIIFTFVITYSDVSGYSNKCVLKLDEIPESFPIFTIREFDMECCLLFSDPKYFNPIASFYLNEGRNIYSHIINLELIAKYVIEMDIDAVIINYLHPNMTVIPREFLLDYLDEIIDLCGKYVDGYYVDYGFLLK